MNSVQPNQSVCADDGRDLYAEDSSNTTYLEELLHSIVTKLPTIDVKCHHSRVSETDVLRLEQSVDEAKERNRILNYQLFEYFREKDEIIGSAADATLTENEDAALKTQRIMRYRELLLQLKSLNDKWKNAEKSTTIQMDDISAVIEKSRDDLSNQRGELQKSIEKVTAEWRADGHTSLTTQNINELVQKIRNEQNGLSAERIAFIKYKILFRDLRLRAPSFDAYGNGIGLHDLTRTQIESENLHQQIADTSTTLKLQRENVSLLNQELADRIKNNELKKERLEQSTRELEEQKRRLCEKRVQLSNWKDEYRKLLQSLKALQNRSPLTDNPLLYVDYEKTMQTIQQHQRFINRYKVDLSN